MRAVIKKRFFSDIILEKDIKVIIHEARYPFPRTLRKEAFDNEGNLLFIFQSDKKEYCLDDRITGKIMIPGDRPKPENVSVSLLKWESYRSMADMENLNEKTHLIENINLEKFLANDNTGKNTLEIP